MHQLQSWLREPSGLMEVFHILPWIRGVPTCKYVDLYPEDVHTSLHVSSTPTAPSSLILSLFRPLGGILHHQASWLRVQCRERVSCVAPLLTACSPAMNCASRCPFSHRQHGVVSERGTANCLSGA